MVSSCSLCLNTPVTPWKTPKPALTGIAPILVPSWVIARPAVLKVEVCIRVLATILGLKTSRSFIPPFSPCLGLTKLTTCSIACNGSIERFIFPIPRLFAASIWFQSKTSTTKSAPYREGYYRFSGKSFQDISKTYHRDFEMFIPIWRSSFLLNLRFEDLLSVKLEDSERIGFSYTISIERQVGREHRTDLPYPHRECHNRSRGQLAKYPGLKHTRHVR